MSKKKIKTIWEKYGIWEIVSAIIIFIVVLFAFTAILGKYSLGGIKLFTVQSGSMEPAIKTGSLVVVKFQDSYSVGDIVTFSSPSSSKETTTHRIADIKTENKSISYQTKGDANNAPDGSWVPKDKVIGKVVFKIPYIGYPIAFARTLPGLVILIIIPATIIIYDEVGNIKKEWRKRKKLKNINKKLAKKGSGGKK